MALKIVEPIRRVASLREQRARDQRIEYLLGIDPGTANTGCEFEQPLGEIRHRGRPSKEHLRFGLHLLALSLEMHYERPVLWFLVHVLVAVAFALLWRRARGQGPLERLVARAANGGRDLVLGHRLNS